VPALLVRRRTNTRLERRDRFLLDADQSRTPGRQALAVGRGHLAGLHQRWRDRGGNADDRPALRRQSDRERRPRLHVQRQFTVEQVAKYFGYTTGIFRELIATGVSYEAGEAGAAASAVEGTAYPIITALNNQPLLIKHPNSESKNLAIELQGLTPGATKAIIRGVYLSAHVRG
jgi:hypothetical protein